MTDSRENIEKSCARWQKREKEAAGGMQQGIKARARQRGREEERNEEKVTWSGKRRRLRTYTQSDRQSRLRRGGGCEREARPISSSIHTYPHTQPLAHISHRVFNSALFQRAHVRLRLPERKDRPVDVCVCTYTRPASLPLERLSS